jgi:hypothetical protein
MFSDYDERIPIFCINAFELMRANLPVGFQYFFVLFAAPTFLDKIFRMQALLTIEEATVFNF